MKSILSYFSFLFTFVLYPAIVGRYFYYQLANIYITVTAGALWTSAAEIIDHPQQLLFILGETLPKLAGYFISLLLTKTLAGLPMVLLRLGALSRMLFLRSCFNKQRLTQRELNEVYRKQPIMYGWEVSGSRQTSCQKCYNELCTYEKCCCDCLISNSVPNTISCDYYLLHLRVYYTIHSSGGSNFLLFCSNCLQETSSLRLHTDV